jgi:hypothetical protein
MRETGCCSFFTFTMTVTAGGLDPDVLADRAAAVRTRS